MIRFALLALLVWLLWRWGGQLLSKQRVRRAQQRDAAARGSDRRAHPLCACAQCGVMIPLERAVVDQAGRPYCGSACRARGAKRTAARKK
ncbi:hypothetical protein [Magnetofaba australis]|uniref:hypothetical protein n=1 Tax=Magnetofaba australis TaxID=1472297 RepID=UPI000A19E5EC|nr:hypothetical protein [Magnetofaba australis]